MATLGTLVLAGCQENIEFTRKPVERAQSETRSAAISPIFVVSRTDATPWIREIDSRLPDRLLGVALNLSRAACVDSNGRKRCNTARVTGGVERDGPAVLKGTASGFSVRIPAKYSFKARGRGAARNVETQATGRVVLTAPFTVSIDQNLQPDVQFGGTVSIEGGKQIQILERTLDVAKPLARKFRNRFRSMTRVFETSFDTSQTAATVETAWRHLHYPIQLRREPPLWLRGDPESVAFGGIGVVDDTLELRIAILGKLATFTSERPVPLIAREVPELDSTPSAVTASHLVMPVDLPYAEIASRIKATFDKAGPLKSPHSTKPAGFTVTRVTLHPADGRIAMAVAMESDMEGSWQKLAGTAYVTATPTLKPGSGVLGLKLAELTAPRPSPVLFEGGKFIVPEKPLIAALRSGLNIKLKERFAAVLGDINRVADTQFAKSYRIRGRFDDLSVHSIETHKTGLRINLDLIGALSVYPGTPTVAAGLEQSQPVSAAQ